MKYRRYYDKRNRARHHWFPELHDIDDYLAAMERLGYDQEQAMSIDTASYEIILDDDEATGWFFDCLRRVHDDPGWYLDNLDSIPTFRVDIMKIFPNVIHGPGRMLEKKRRKP